MQLNNLANDNIYQLNACNNVQFIELHAIMAHKQLRLIRHGGDQWPLFINTNTDTVMNGT